MKRTRTTPLELRVGELLTQRHYSMQQSEEDLLKHAEKGYVGEGNFDIWLLEQLPQNWIVLQDVWLTINGSTIQIDSLVITPKNLLLFEVKNFEGPYYLEGDYLFTEHRFEIKNPTLQLKRTETLLRQLLKKRFPTSTPSIDSYICFIHPRFYLYNAQISDSHFLFYNLLKSFKEKIIHENSHPINHHRKIAEYLFHQQTEPHYKKRFDYQENDLIKGIICVKCGEVLGYEEKKGIYIICSNCKYNEKWYQAIIRTIDEFMTLFPKEKVTTSNMSRWCNVPNKRAIQRILSSHFQRQANRKSAHYSKKTINTKIK